MKTSKVIALVAALLLAAAGEVSAKNLKAQHLLHDPRA